MIIDGRGLMLSFSVRAIPPLSRLCLRLAGTTSRHLLRARAHARHWSCALLLIMSSACGRSTEPEVLRETTLFVAAQRVPCLGAFPQSCLQVRESTVAAWTLFYDDIAGFAFEPGFEYELRVRIVRVTNPPVDGSTLRYELIRQVKRTPS